jgi:hypothetical protein
MAKQPTEEVLQQRRDILTARGVPEAFIENIATRRDYLISPTITALAFSFMGIGLGAGLASWLIDHFADWMWDYVTHAGLNVNARLFFYSNIQQFSFIFLMIGIMGIPSLLWLYFNRKVAPYPAPNETATSLREPANDQISHWMLRYIQHEAQTAKTETEFLAGSSKGSLIVVSWMTAGLFVIAGIIFALGHGHFWALYPDRLVAHDFGQEKVYRLEDVTTVTLGCNHTDDGEYLIYKLHFAGGKFNLDDGDLELTEAAFLDRLEQVNNDLRLKPNIKFERWKWLKRDPLARECIGYWQEVGGADGKARIERLLAVP